MGYRRAMFRRSTLLTALLIVGWPLHASALEVENGDFKLPKRSVHGTSVAPAGFHITGKHDSVVSFHAAPPFDRALAVHRGAELSCTIQLPPAAKPKKIDPSGWYAVASIDVLGRASDASAELHLHVRVQGSRRTLAQGSLRPTTPAPRGGRTSARSKLDGRLWVKVPSADLSRHPERTIELIVSTTGPGGVVIDNVRLDLFHDAPSRALVGKPNGRNGPDLLASGMLGFLALTEHNGTAFSLLEIREDGPADRGGMKRTDLVVAVEGTPLGPGSLAAGKEWFLRGHEAVLGRAIESALQEGRDRVALTVLRERRTRTLSLRLPIRRAFADSFPFHDPLADRMRKDITGWIVENQKPNGFWPHNPAVNGCLAGLALLGTRDRRHAEALHKLADAFLEKYPRAQEVGGFSYWGIAFQGIFLAEYHLASGDRRARDWVDGAIRWLPATTHKSAYGMQAFGHSPKGLPYGNKALMAPCAHLLVLEALALRCGIHSRVWEHIGPYVIHSWSDPKKKGGHGGMGYNGSAKDKAQFWSRSGLTALALHLRDDRPDMRAGLTGIMVRRHEYLLNSHAYGEPGGALGLVSLYAVDPDGFKKVLPQWRWRFLNAWQPGFGLRYSSPHMGAPYMGEEGIVNPAYGMLLAIQNGGLVLAGGQAKRWLRR
ncbi:MAG: DUF6288 domain-containing protein [Planctomycetota bacterium]|jgi:hypothetical protein